MNKPKCTFVLFCLILSLFVFPKSVFSSSYDVYVDSGYKDGDSDGSSEKPYKTIEKAAEEGGKIYVKNGTYEENVSLKKNSELYGQSRDKTIIKGKIEAKDENAIENITTSGGTYGINALGKINIDNCKIKNSKIGINLPSGGGKASITDSVITGNGKGFYVQRGRTIEITGNSIYGNKEEGVDVREKVDGTIKENEITGNGEGGIEIIVGGSNVAIIKNTIKGNKASGIAAQFYSFIEKTGSIEITSNSLSKNGKYGFTCAIPSGGDPSGSYWNSSIDLKENTIEGNGIKAIDSFCNIIEAVDKEEEKANKVATDAADLEEEAENAEIRENIIQEQAKEQNTANINLIKSSEEEIQKINKTNGIKTFFWGIDKESLEPLEKKNKEIEAQIYKLKNMLEEAGSQEAIDLINGQMRDLGSQSEKINSFIEKKESQFSLFGWIAEFFNR